jgi:hypothetical protein
VAVHADQSERPQQDEATHKLHSKTSDLKHCAK